MTMYHHRCSFAGGAYTRVDSNQQWKLAKLRVQCCFQLFIHVNITAYYTSASYYTFAAMAINKKDKYIRFWNKLHYNTNKETFFFP